MFDVAIVGMLCLLCFIVGFGLAPIAQLDRATAF